MHYVRTRSPRGDTFSALARTAKVSIAPVCDNAAPPDLGVSVAYDAESIGILGDLLARMARDDLHASCTVVARGAHADDPELCVAFRHERLNPRYLRTRLCRPGDDKAACSFPSHAVALMTSAASHVSPALCGELIAQYRARGFVRVAVQTSARGAPLLFLADRMLILRA